MPESMGKNFDDRILKSPLTVGRPRKEPGPDVNNSPVAVPDDPLRIIPDNSKRMTRSDPRGSLRDDY